MKTSLKRCALAIIMCGVSALGMAQEVLWEEDFSNFTIVQSWTDKKEKQINELWYVLYCSIQGYFNGKEVKALKIDTHYDKKYYYGYVKTPSLNVGDYVLTFKHIKTANNKNSQIKVSLLGQGQFCDNNKTDTIININNNAWTTKTLNIVGATSESKIKFELTSTNACLIDNIVVIKDGITLNESSENNGIITAYDEEIMKVKTSRTLVGGIWNTLCLPFNVSQATMEAALGTGQDIQMRTYSSYADGVMNFTPVADTDIIEAGTPFLLKLNTTVTNPTFTSVTVSDTPAKTINHDGVCFVGTYSQKDLSADGTDVFITTSGSLAIPTADGTTMKGMRAHVTVPESMKFTIDGVRLAIDHDETTAIRPTAGEQQSGTIYYYDLNGQRLQQPRKGLNIVRSAETHQQGKNGKLTFIR